MNIGLTAWAQFDRAIRDPKGSASALASATLSNFEDLIAALQAWFPAQHNPDGTHADVTADSLEVGDITALGKIHLGASVTYVVPAIFPSSRIDNCYVPGLESASILRIQTNGDATLTLSGIDAAGRRQGSLLLLINDDLSFSTPDDFGILADDTNSALGNRFIGGSAAAAPWTLHGSQAVLLMYDQYSPTGVSTLGGWRVISGV